MRKSPWRWLGQADANGVPVNFFIGIPARDLTADDVANLTDEQYATVEASKLYEQATVKPSRPVTEVPGGN